jgi:CHAT domain-containing protein/tetratricopeptide (TPR) repeat protein
VLTLLCLSILSAFLLGTVSRAQAPPEPRPERADGQTQDPTPLPILELGRSVPRDLKAGQSHTYRVVLEADQLLSAVVDQRGVDVAMTLAGPDGVKLADLDNVLGTSGRETLTVIAAAVGEHRLEVRSGDKSAAPGRYDVAIIARRSPTADERRLEDARRLTEDARGRRQKGKYDEAVPPAERALAITESVLGADHPAVADALHMLAVLFDDTHDYGKAEPLNQRALAIREKALGPDHPDVARSLFNLAWLAKVKQDFSAAESLYRRTQEVQERALGAEHTEVAATLNDLALLYGERGDIDQAIQIHRRVLAIREKALDANDAGVAVAHNNLALSYELRADYPEAVSHFGSALQIWERALGPEHPDLGYALDGLAQVHYQTGDYASAEPLYLRALALREKALGSDAPEVATTLNNLAMLYRQKGDYAKAEPLLLRDLAITERRVGPDDTSVATTLANLASIYASQGEFAKADGLFRRSLAIREKALGPTHPGVGRVFRMLGQLYAENPSGGETEARSFLDRSLAILESTLGADHHQVAAPLATLGVLAARRADYAAAERYHQRALAIQEKALGPDHPEVAQSLERLSEVSRARGDLRESVHLLQRAHETRERHLVHNLPLGSERQKLAYLKLFAQDVDRSVSLHARVASDPLALELAFTTLLRRKGRALDATVDNIGALRVRARPQDRELFDRLLAARSQLAALTLRGPGADDTDAYRSRLGQLADALDRLEAEVGARSAEFRAQSLPVTVAAIRAQLPEHAALIEFAWYRPTAETEKTPAPPRYAAYLLADGGEPQWVDLGEAAAIDGALTEWRQALRDPERPDARHLGRALDARLMEPVRARLGSVGHVLISPDGELNLVPFAALVDERDSYLVERFTITYLTSGRDLLRLQVRPENRSPPVILAAPAFGEPALATNRGPRPRLDDSQVFFGPLPGAASEVRELKKLLPTATLLTGAQATEAALRRVDGPRLLHVATHGFFLRDEEGAADRDPNSTSTDGTRLGKWARWVENPLLRSGLALAGANQGRSGEDDGVLTALEAAGLDLWGTRLVVLSACDTGLGEVKRGDGVYGLRRALVLAGAESQLISLWPVSDRSTRDLMIGYYELLAQGESRGEALRRAQLRMVRNLQRAHPYYWASFIQSGQWTKLDGGLTTER